MNRYQFSGAIALAALLSAPTFAQTLAATATRPDVKPAASTKPLCSTLRSRTGGNLAGNANAQGKSANSAVALDCTADATSPPGAGEYALDSRTATPVSPTTTVNTPRTADNPVYSPGTVSGTTGSTSGRTGNSLSPTPSTPSSMTPSTTTSSTATPPPAR